MPLRLHLGCGSRYLEGWTNVDRWSPDRKDLVADVAALPFRPGTVDEIFSSHVIEHLPRAGAPRALAHWAQLLKPGGKLAVECPDLEAVCRRFLAAGEQERQGWWIYVLYGLQTHRGEFHLNNFTGASLRAQLERAGLERVRIGPGDPFHANSCGMRAEAWKPGAADRPLGV